MRLTPADRRNTIGAGNTPFAPFSRGRKYMKKLLWKIVSPLLAIFGYDKKDKEPPREDDQFEHLWWDIGGEG